MKILHKNEKGGWEKVEAKEYVNEAELQDLLSKDVMILPLDEIGYDSQFVTIGKEVSLDNGYLDLLAVSAKGQIVLIETKLSSNPEVKRTVVGQILGYAAYLWNKNYEDLEKFFRDYLRQERINFNGSLADYVSEKTGEPNFDPEVFQSEVERKLQGGSFSLMIVVNKSNSELTDIANYLNERTGQEVDFYVVEVEQIGDGRENFLTPRVVNSPRKTVFAKPVSNKYGRQKMTKEEFLSRLDTDGHRIANVLFDKLEGADGVMLAFGTSGFGAYTVLPQELLRGGKYKSAWYSYFFFAAGTEADPSKNHIYFSYTEGFWKDLPLVRPLVEKYREYYQSLKGIDTKFYLKDLSSLKDSDVEKMIGLITETAKKLQKTS